MEYYKELEKVDNINKGLENIDFVKYFKQPVEEDFEEPWQMAHYEDELKCIWDIRGDLSSQLNLYTVIGNPARISAIRAIHHYRHLYFYTYAKTRAQIEEREKIAVKINDVLTALVRFLQHLGDVGIFESYFAKKFHIEKNPGWYFVTALIYEYTKDKDLFETKQIYDNIWQEYSRQTMTPEVYSNIFRRSFHEEN